MAYSEYYAFIASLIDHLNKLGIMDEFLFEVDRRGQIGRKSKSMRIKRRKGNDKTCKTRSRVYTAPTNNSSPDTLSDTELNVIKAMVENEFALLRADKVLKPSK